MSTHDRKKLKQQMRVLKEQDKQFKMGLLIEYRKLGLTVENLIKAHDVLSDDIRKIIESMP